MVNITETREKEQKETLEKMSTRKNENMVRTQNHYSALNENTPALEQGHFNGQRTQSCFALSLCILWPGLPTSVPCRPSPRTLRFVTENTRIISLLPNKKNALKNTSFAKRSNNNFREDEAKYSYLKCIEYLDKNKWLIYVQFKY